MKVEPEELDRRTKPFMVEGAVMCLEAGLFEFSSKDTLIDEQLRAYHVKTWSQHGWANTYDSGNVGDHDLDALVLALLGIELKYGILYKPRPRPATATSMSLISGFGSQSVEMGMFDKNSVAEKRILDKSAAGVPSRQVSTLQRIAASAGRIASMQRGSAFVTMNRPSLGRPSAPNANGVISRTANFRNSGTPGYGRSQDPYRVRRSPL
jgi:hypothetical protein